MVWSLSWEDSSAAIHGLLYMMAGGWNPLEVSSVTRVVVEAGCQLTLLGCWPEHLHVACPHGLSTWAHLGFLSDDGWVPNAPQESRQGRTA